MSEEGTSGSMFLLFTRHGLQLSNAFTISQFPPPQSSIHKENDVLLAVLSGGGASIIWLHLAVEPIMELMIVPFYQSTTFPSPPWSLISGLSLLRLHGHV